MKSQRRNTDKLREPNMKIVLCVTKLKRILRDQTLRTTMWCLFHSANTLQEVDLSPSLLPGRVHDKDHTFSAANVQQQTDNEAKLIAC